MGLTLLTAPAEEPVSLAEARAHLRVDTVDDDALIGALIVAAREVAETRTGRALVTQRWRLTLDTWPDAGDGYPGATQILLPKPPLASVDAISYLDANGTRQTLDPSAYQIILDTLVGIVQPAYATSWPACRATPGSIRIDYTAGYGTAAAVPQTLKAWMLLAIATWYAQRETVITGTIVSELPRAFWDGLLDGHTHHRF